MSSPEQMIWELRQDAKWGRDVETQKRAIQELGKMGAPAMSILEEVMAVSSRSDIRECCRDVINGITNVRTETEKISQKKWKKSRFPKKKSTEAESKGAAGRSLSPHFEHPSARQAAAKKNYNHA
jgi:chromatin remodeling complex protein RSC6